MALRLLYLIFIRLAGLLMLLGRSAASKDTCSATGLRRCAAARITRSTYVSAFLTVLGRFEPDIRAR